MSPEEFDNRLKSSFQDEYLPPKDQLWQNINQRLDQNAAKPYWYWLVPVIAVFAAGIAWFGLKTSDITGTDTVAVVSTMDSSLNSTARTDASSSAETASVPQGNIASATAPADPASVVTENNQNISRSNEHIAAQSSHRGSTAVVSENSGNGKSRHSKGDKLANNNTTAADRTVSNAMESGNDNAENTSAPEQTQLSTANGNTTDNESFSLRTPNVPRFFIGLRPENIGLVNLEAPRNTAKLNKPKTLFKSVAGYRYNYNNEDMISDHWLSVSLGPQMSFNKLVSKNDSEAYIHKNLWANRNKLTHNGGGFFVQALYGSKFGKNKRFIFDIGLSYALRTENIKINESSPDIALRDTNFKIALYKSHVLLKGVIRFPNGDSAITYYEAVANFSQSETNKYSVISIPFNLKSEHKLSENTFFAAGLGGAASAIYTKRASHMNMVYETVYVQRKTVQFNAQLNANMSVYTNFNDIGQIGLYAGFNMYVQPWKVIPNQYSVRMGDLQFGVLYRKPLNLGR